LINQHCQRLERTSNNPEIIGGVEKFTSARRGIRDYNFKSLLLGEEHPQKQRFYVINASKEMKYQRIN
jgi:hypothetical protein